MKKLGALILIAAGVLTAEQVCIRLYKIWWVRWWPLEAPPEFVTDGLGRQLVKAPLVASSVFGHQGYWIGWHLLIVDVWQITAMALGAYLLVRFGVVLFEREVTRARA